MYVSETDLKKKLHHFNNKIETPGRDTLICTIEEGDYFTILVNQHLYLSKNGILNSTFEDSCILKSYEDASEAIDNFFSNFPNGKFIIPRPI